MRKSGAALHLIVSRIKRTQAHSSWCEVLDRELCLPFICSQPPAQIPGSCKVGIKGKRPVDRGNTTGQITDQKGNGVSAPSERRGIVIVLAQVNCMASQAHGFVDIPCPRSVSQPLILRQT